MYCEDNELLVWCHMALSGCFSHSVVSLKKTATVSALSASLLMTKLSRFTWGQIKAPPPRALCIFRFFLSCDRRWFYVTFLSSWLLKWDSAFHPLSGAATMTGLRPTDKMNLCAAIYWMPLWLGGLVWLSRHQQILANVFFHWAVFITIAAVTIDILLSFLSCQTFVIRALFSWRLRQPSGQPNSFSALSCPVCLN